MALELSEFLSELRSMSSVTERAIEEVRAMQTSLREDLGPASAAIKAMEVSKTVEGFIRFNDVPTGVLHETIAAGNLAKLVELSKLNNIVITKVEEDAFRTMIGNTNEMRLNDLENLINENKRTYPELDAADVNELSETAKTKLETAQSNLFKYFKNGTIIILTVGTVVVGTNWAVKATKERRGCFMLDSKDKSSCKVSKFTCSTDSAVGTLCTSVNDTYYNVTLIMIHFAQLDNGDASKIAFANAINEKPEDLNDRLDVIVSTKFKQAATYIKQLGIDNRPSVDTCGLKHDKIENGTVPACRMCTPSADPISTQFIDSSQYGANITFKCVSEVSILDTITDTAASAAVDLFEGITSTVWGVVQPILRYGLIIVGVIILLIVCFKIINASFRSNAANANVRTENIRHDEE